MTSWRRVVPAIGLCVVAPIGGLWLWGRPRADVAMPTARDSPTAVVRTYVRALNDRDFSACVHLEVDRDNIGANWASLHAPNMQGFTIDHVQPVMSGRHAAVYQSDPELTTWDQTVEVDTTATLNNFEGFHESQPDQPWSFELVRDNSSQPWLILNQGQG